MPRTSRKTSETGIYHIILRGIGRKNIFHEEEDYNFIKRAISKSKEKASFEIYTYCLMSNHIHILIKEGKEPIGESIKRIAVSYVQYYNTKYESIGHLFQDRFKSEPVETDEYFKIVYRYIIQNPIKARIIKDISEYKWSSYYNYSKGNEDELIDYKYTLEVFKSNNELKEFILEENENKCLEYYNKPSEESIRKYFIKIIGNKKLSDLTIEERKIIINKLRKKNYNNDSQISRVTGIERGIIRGIKK